MIPEFKQWQDCMKTDSFSECLPLYKVYVEKKRSICTYIHDMHSICEAADRSDSKCTRDPEGRHQRGHPSSYES